MPLELASKNQRDKGSSVVDCWGPGFEPQLRHCVVSLSKNINSSLVLVQPRKTRPFITERLLMGRKESNQRDNAVFVTDRKNKQKKL